MGRRDRREKEADREEGFVEELSQCTFLRLSNSHKERLEDLKASFKRINPGLHPKDLEGRGAKEEALEALEKIIDDLEG
jgi:hypothetical protein